MLDSVIVIEDDRQFILSFLDYMLQGLDRYREEPQVYQIAGFMSQVEHSETGDAFFLPYTKPRGWATWARAWSAFDWEVPGFFDMYSDWRLRWRFDLDGHCRYAGRNGACAPQRNGVRAGASLAGMGFRLVLVCLPTEGIGPVPTPLASMGRWF